MQFEHAVAKMYSVASGRLRGKSIRRRCAPRDRNWSF
jgi:hypothetical protein